MVDYTWVAWFEELATTIARNDEHYLAGKARDVDWNGDDIPLLNHGDGNIDPMSFLYTLAQKNTVNQFGIVFPSVHEVFDIDSACPEIRPIIPGPQEKNINASFHDQNTFNPDLLWRLFRQAVPIEGEIEIQSEDFNAALNRRNVRNVDISKLTQTLFIAKPSYFLPADHIISIALPQSEFHGNVEDHEGYVAVMDAMKRRFPRCSPYEINTFLDTQEREPLVTTETKFFQISTKAYDDGTDYWESADGLEKGLPFKENNYVYTCGPGEKKLYPLRAPKRGDIVLVRTGLWQGRAIGVVEDNGYNPDGWDEDEFISVFWINKMTALTERQLPQIGFSRAGKSSSAFRKTAAYSVSFDLIDRWIRGNGGESQPDPAPAPPAGAPDTSFSLNTILFGPPGTGKTWEAVSYAVAILDEEDPADLTQAEDREDVKARFDELRKDEQIEFVTFHQSYTYEDFVEGIGPVLNNDDLLYELRDGIFKRIALRAADHPNQRYVLIIDEINRGNIAKIFGELITLIEPSKRSGAEDAAVVTFPYSQEEFSVPGNLYLVGTMNTADRGIALLDTALRRRFDFIEKMPDVRHVEEDIEGVNGRDMLKAMNERITVYLDREHQIGHTYLIGVTTIDRLAEGRRSQIDIKKSS